MHGINYRQKGNCLNMLTANAMLSSTVLLGAIGATANSQGCVVRAQCILEGQLRGSHGV